jgi:hypothetical protein
MPHKFRRLHRLGQSVGFDGSRGLFGFHADRPDQFFHERYGIHDLSKSLGPTDNFFFFGRIESTDKQSQLYGSDSHDQRHLRFHCR